MGRALMIAVVALTVGACASWGSLETDPHPGDDRPESAVSISVGEAVQDRVGPESVDRRDWKSFTVAGASRLRVRLSMAPTPTVLKVHVVNRRNGQHMGTMTAQPGQEQALVANFPSGVYHIEIQTSSETQAIAYALVVESAAP